MSSNYSPVMGVKTHSGYFFEMFVFKERVLFLVDQRNGLVRGLGFRSNVGPKNYLMADTEWTKMICSVEHAITQAHLTLWDSLISHPE